MPYAHVCGAVCIATIGGLTFEDGGGLTLAPVKVDFTTAAGTLVPDAAYSGIWSPTREYLPLGDTGMSVLPSPVPSSVKISLADVATQQRRLGWLFSQIRCSYIHGKLESLRRMDPSPPTVRWVGTGSPGSALGCNGISRTPGSTILLLAPLPETLAHELSHTLGLAHTLSLEGQPAGAEALPYVGIGANGYRTSGTIFEPHKTSDLMGYTDGRQNGRCTSPRTWFRTHVAIVGRVAKASGAGTGVARVAASASHAPKLTRRRLVSGLLARGAGVIFSSRVVDATANAGGSPVIGRLARRVPFVVALPPTARAAALQLRARNGTRLATLRRSRHRPAGRFVRLVRRARRSWPLTVRWRASDGDRDRVSVILQARGRAAWKTVARGPAKSRARFGPRSFSRRSRLRLRLLISDGFNSRTINARPVRLASR